MKTNEVFDVRGGGGSVCCCTRENIALRWLVLTTELTSVTSLRRNEVLSADVYEPTRIER